MNKNDFNHLRLKIIDIMYKCINYIYGLMILAIIVTWICFTHIGFGGNSYYRNYLPAWILIPFGIIFIFGVLAFLERYSASGKYLKYISLMFFILQIYSTWNYYFYTDWDSSTLTMFADTLAHKEDISWMTGYFSRYPNNIFLAYIFSIIEKCVHNIGLHSMEYFSIIFVQCIIANITGILMFQIIKKLTNKIVFAYLGYILYILLVGLSPWVSIPYSDSMGLFFPTMIYYLYIHEIKDKHTIMTWLLITSLAIIGYKIKPQIFILFIAIIFSKLFSTIKTKKICKKSILGILSGAIIAELLINVTLSQVPLIIDHSQAFGIKHYFMMGMNPDSMGVYSEDDVQFSASFSSVEERNTADMAKAVERVKQMGTYGVLKQYIRKTLTNYYDGTFCWAGEGEFFVKVLDEKNLPGCKLLRGLYYTKNHSDVGKYYPVWSNFEQMLWLSIIILNFISVFVRKDISTNVLMLGIIGLSLFELLFEARARYLYIYVPLYIILAIYGISFINQKISTKKISSKDSAV